MNIKLENVSKTIKGKTLLDNVSLDLHGGMIYGLQGKNGSGKTLLLKAMCGLLIPTEGTVTVGDDRLGIDSDFPKDVGVLIENPGFISGYTAYKNLKVLAEIKNKIQEQDILAILDEVGLAECGKKKYRNFSLGMKQKLGIAAALMENPKLILLDEPTNALDEKSVENLMRILKRRKEEGALIVIASHDKEELEALADKIYLVEEGKVSEKKNKTMGA